MGQPRSQDIRSAGQTQAWGGAQPNGIDEQLARGGVRMQDLLDPCVLPRRPPTGTDCPAPHVHEGAETCPTVFVALSKAAPWVSRTPLLALGALLPLPRTVLSPERPTLPFSVHPRLSWHGGCTRPRAALTWSQTRRTELPQRSDVCVVLETDSAGISWE